MGLSSCLSSRIWKPRRFTARSGFSLLEVLLIITMLSVTILPFTLIISQTGTNTRGVYIQSSRSILLNSLMDEATVDRNYFAPLYTNVAMDTSTSESGQVLPWRRVVDTTNAGASDTFKKTMDFYLYNKSTDAANAPRYKTKRVRFDDPGQNNGWVDASGQWWEPTNFYDSANLVPGFPSTNNNYWDTTPVVNLPSHFDQELYQSGQWQAGSTLNYSANVSNGTYIVKLYFVENGYPGRLMDITLENKLMNPGQPFNANLRCGGRNYCGVIQMYDIAVTDGVLNIQISVNSGATHTDPFINGISIKKRT